MQLHCLAIDKVRFKPYQQGCEEYLKRLRRYVKVNSRELKPARGQQSPDALKEIEGARLLDALPPSCVVVALDERGVSMTSEALARWLDARFAIAEQPCFIIGGAFGLAPVVRQRAKLTLQLSAMTLPHELARLFLFEQLYRSMTILRGEPYHK